MLYSCDNFLSCQLSMHANHLARCTDQREIKCIQIFFLVVFVEYFFRYLNSCEMHNNVYIDASHCATSVLHCLGQLDEILTEKICHLYKQRGPWEVGTTTAKNLQFKNSELSNRAELSLKIMMLLAFVHKSSRQGGNFYLMLWNILPKKHLVRNLIMVKAVPESMF